MATVGDPYPAGVDPAPSRLRVDCRACQNFRPAVPTARVLQRELLQLSSSQLLRELRAIGDSDNEWEAHEAREREDKSSTQNTPDAQTWAARPRTLAYCGVNEPNGSFRLWELMNTPEAPCQLSEESKPPVSCRTCVHNAPTGAGNVLTRLREVMNDFPPAGSDAFQDVDKEYQTYIGVHLHLVADGDGVVASAPSFLPVCRRYSTPGDDVISILHNRSHRCAGYEEGIPAPPAALDNLGQLYRSATSGIAGYSRVALDPKRLAMIEFIAASMRYLGLGAAVPALVMKLTAAANQAASSDMRQAGAIAPPKLSW